MLDFIERAVASRELQELWDLHAERMAAFGFPRLLYGYTRVRQGDSLGETEDALVLTTHTSDYLRRFVGEGLYRQAPMTRWCMNNVGPCSWRWIDEQAAAGLLSPAESRVHEFNQSRGLVAGYTISFSDLSARAKAAISLGAPKGTSHDEAEAIWAAHGREILAINNVAHLRYATLPHIGARRPLTDRQREVLEWVGRGKTMSDIAAIMGLRLGTVEKHLRLARAALGVETTAQAVLKAGIHNQIYVVSQ